MLCVKTGTPTPGVLGELGRYPLSISIKLQIIKYWLRLLSLPEHWLVKKAYLLSLYLDINNFVSWASLVREILQETSLNVFYNNENFVPRNNIVAMIENRLKLLYKDVWRQNCINSEKLTLLHYNIFKSEFVLEPYLLNVKNFYDRISFSQLRLSSHKLHIETGRYVRPKIDRCNRLCNACNQVEDEKHLLLHCQKFVVARNFMFNTVSTYHNNFSRMSDHGKYIFLLSNAECTIQCSLAKFIRNCFTKLTKET